MPTYLACFRAHVQRRLACLCTLRALLPTCLSIPTSSCAITPNIKNKFLMTCITSNIKNKFSMTCFLEIFLVFYLWNKIAFEKWTTRRNVSRKIFLENSVAHFGISFIRRKALTAGMKNFLFELNFESHF